MLGLSMHQKFVVDLLCFSQYWYEGVVTIVCDPLRIPSVIDSVSALQRLYSVQWDVK